MNLLHDIQDWHFHPGLKAVLSHFTWAFHFIDLSMLNKSLMIKLITFQVFFFPFGNKIIILQNTHHQVNRVRGLSLSSCVHRLAVSHPLRRDLFQCFRVITPILTVSRCSHRVCSSHTTSLALILYRNSAFSTPTNFMTPLNHFPIFLPESTKYQPVYLVEEPRVTRKTGINSIHWGNTSDYLNIFHSHLPYLQSAHQPWWYLLT